MSHRAKRRVRQSSPVSLSDTTGGGCVTGLDCPDCHTCESGNCVVAPAADCAENSHCPSGEVCQTCTCETCTTTARTDDPVKRSEYRYYGDETEEYEKWKNCEQPWIFFQTNTSSGQGTAMLCGPGHVPSELGDPLPDYCQQFTDGGGDGGGGGGGGGSGCSSDAECGPCQSCFGGSCIEDANCRSDSECPGNQVCQNCQCRDLVNVSACSVPNTAGPNQPIDVSVDLENQSDSSREITAQVDAQGNPVGTVTETVPANSTTTATVSFTPSDHGLSGDVFVNASPTSVQSAGLGNNTRLAAGAVLLVGLGAYSLSE